MNILLRLAGLNDAKLLFLWFNKIENLKFKIKTDKKINFLSHKKWFIERIHDQYTFIWIIENDNKKALGQIRFQKANDTYYEIDIFILDEYRKMKIASRALSKAQAYSNINNLRAIVKKNNYTSYLFFINNGFKVSAENNISWTLSKK